MTWKNTWGIRNNIQPWKKVEKIWICGKFFNTMEQYTIYCSIQLFPSFYLFSFLLIISIFYFQLIFYPPVLEGCIWCKSRDVYCSIHLEKLPIFPGFYPHSLLFFHLFILSFFSLTFLLPYFLTFLSFFPPVQF